MVPMVTPRVHGRSGGNGTGIPFHFHSDSWLELVAGRKSWWIFPPGANVPFNELEPHAPW